MIRNCYGIYISRNKYELAIAQKLINLINKNETGNILKIAVGPDKKLTRLSTK